jgi:serine/threonine-protein kinase
MRTMQAKIPMLDPVGRVLGGRYRVVRKVGSGGMGSVYEATQQDLNRSVAVKILHPHLADDYELVERFRREAQAAAALGHPNIVGVIDFNNDGPEPPFIVMELLKGQSLREVMEKSGPLQAKRVALIASQALSALGAAHKAGIVHRDIKPDNLFLVPVSARREVTMVLDFGVAKLMRGEEVTSAGTLIGTLAYMSPEQARARPVDGRADLYSIAAVMYHALTGSLPLEATTHPGMLTAILSQIPKPASERRPDVDPAFCAIIDRGLSKDPEKRFSSAEEMEHQISTWVDQFQISGNIPNSVRPPRSGTVPMPAVQAAQPTIRSSPPGPPGAAADSRPPSGARHGGTVPLSAMPTVPSGGQGAIMPQPYPVGPAAIAHPTQGSAFTMSPPVNTPNVNDARISYTPASSNHPAPASSPHATLRSATESTSRGPGILVWLLLFVGIGSLAAAAFIGWLVVWPRQKEAEHPQNVADAGATPTNTTPSGAPSAGTNAVPAEAGATTTPASPAVDAGKPVLVATKTRKVRVCDNGTNMYGAYPTTWVEDKVQERLPKIRACYQAGPWDPKNETWVHYRLYFSPQGDVYRTEDWANPKLHSCVEKALVGIALGPPRNDAGQVKVCVSSWEE